MSGVQVLFLSLSQNLRFCQLPHQREPLRGDEMQKTVRFTRPEREARGSTLGVRPEREARGSALGVRG